MSGPVEHIRTYGLVRTKFLTKEVYVILFFTPLLKVPNSNLHDLEVLLFIVQIQLKDNFFCLFIMQSSSKVKIMSRPRLNAFHRACLGGRGFPNFYGSISASLIELSTFYKEEGVKKIPKFCLRTSKLISESKYPMTRYSDFPMVFQNV